MLRVVIIAAFFMHGMAHLSGFFASWTASTAGFSERPWVLSASVTMHSGVGRVFGLLWLLAAIGLLGTALGLATQQPWWPMLGVLAAAVSLVAIVPWWNTVPPGAKV